MSPEEREIMELSIKNATLEGFQVFTETVNKKIDTDISNHKASCPFSGKANGSFADVIKDWKTVAASIIGIAWIISTTITVLNGKPLNSFTPEQVRQLAQQVQEVTNPLPVTESR